MAFNFTLPLRIVQGIFAIVVLGLTAYVANWWSGHWHDLSPSEVNFLIFSSVWTLLALAYLIIAPARFPNAAHKYGILAAEAITMIFWFAGFIALAVFLSDRVCFGRVCDAAKAGTAFAAFEWLFFAATTLMAVLHVYRTRNTGVTSHDPKVEMHQGV
ncbi:hypothetical protein K432DRAFT_303022 [Lepidopterella palustris CBS 459.81]|uniref:MARVEL domain-containing protein n=1 Tax=Lepidopterella palustris CBS 459.81 TaxID=1314670 RepID=A0A8E2E5V9_9PEZI|nr:hypothetical protein K432DRAFT_303022 [Lepidopterella palustris CBS 459.81]